VLCTASDVYLYSFRVKRPWVASFSLNLQMFLVCSLSEGYVNSLDSLCDVCFVASSVQILLLWKRGFGHEPSVITDFTWVISVVPYIDIRSSSNRTTTTTKLNYNLFTAIAANSRVRHAETPHPDIVFAVQRLLDTVSWLLYVSGVRKWSLRRNPGSECVAADQYTEIIIN